jgi:GMP synthase (glutamine-hydrolysing)
MTATLTAPPAPGPSGSSADRRKLRVLLIQVRDQAAAERHEQQCFLDRLGLVPEQLDTVNVVAEPVPDLARAQRADVVILGGAGAHSAYVDYPFTAPLVDLVGELVAIDKPFFGACFGHQFLGRALGGKVVHDPENEEIGTFDVEVTPEGQRDPLLAGLPTRFKVHLGHHDRVVDVPAGVLTLASTGKCEHQVIRVAGKPIYGAQFHPEMTEQHMRERVMMYAADYMAGDDPAGQLARRLQPTPIADQLLARFVATVV